MAMDTAGWGFPGNARKAHFFDALDSISICKRWMYTGDRDPNTALNSPDDCTACRKVLAKRAEAK